MAGWPAAALDAVTLQPWGWSVGENGIEAAFDGCSMCCIAPGGIPGIGIDAPGDIAAAELTTIDEAIVATTIPTTIVSLSPRAPEFGILAPKFRLLCRSSHPDSPPVVPRATASGPELADEYGQVRHQLVGIHQLNVQRGRILLGLRVL